MIKNKKKINISEINTLLDSISQSIKTHKGAMSSATGASYSYLLGGLLCLRNFEVMLEKLLNKFS